MIASEKQDALWGSFFNRLLQPGIGTARSFGLKLSVLDP